MAFSIVTFSNSLKNLLDKHNTTTSATDISSGLKERIKRVTVGYHKNKPIPVTDFPCIWVEPRRQENEFATTGRTALRDITLNYDIACITNIGPGYEDGRETADQEMLTLSTNVETMLRNYPALSVTSQVMWSTITDVEYDVENSNDTYNSIAKINLQIKMRST